MAPPMTKVAGVPGTRPDFGPALVLATSGALLTLAPVTAKQFGLLDHLPDPSARIFASDQITDSSMAHPLGIPDGVLGIASYSATLGLVLLARKRPIAHKLLAAKLVADGTVAAFTTVRQVAGFRKLCSWCMATAICTALMVIAGRKVIATELSRL
jgi:uncharacterized membrane protein